MHHHGSPERFSKVHKNLKRLRNTVLRVIGFTYDTPEPEWR